MDKAQIAEWLVAFGVVIDITAAFYSLSNMVFFMKRREGRRTFSSMFIHHIYAMIGMLVGAVFVVIGIYIGGIEIARNILRQFGVEL